MSTAERRLSENMDAMSRGLEMGIRKVSGQTMGHLLVVVPLETPGPRFQWASNMDRTSLLSLVRGLMEALESSQPAVPFHKVN